MGALRCDRTLLSARVLFTAKKKFLQRENQICSLHHPLLHFRSVSLPSAIVGGLLRWNSLLLYAEPAGTSI